MKRDSNSKSDNDDYVDYVELRKGTLPMPEGYTSPFTPLQEKLATIREIPYGEVYWLCKAFNVDRNNLPEGCPDSFLECQFHPLYYIWCRLMQINYEALAEVAKQDAQLMEKGFEKKVTTDVNHEWTKSELDTLVKNAIL